MNKYSLYVPSVLILAMSVWLGVPEALRAQVPGLTPATEPDQQQAAPSSSLGRAMHEAAEAIEGVRLDQLWDTQRLQQWLIILVAACVGLVLGKVVAAVLRRVGRRFGARGWNVWQQFLVDLSGPISLTTLTIGLAGGIFGVYGSGISSFWRGVLNLLFSIAVLWYLYNLMSVTDVLVRRLAGRNGSALDRQLAPMIRKTLRIVLVVLGILFIVNNVFNKDIGTWLAGLGIAGLAVSLAAQDSIKNVFGSITVLIDRPFRVGEAITCSGQTGAVEEIGFRSTKIRTFTGNVVTIPNSIVANEVIENIGRRPYIRRLFNVTITYDTPRAKIQEAIDILRRLLEEPGIAEPIHPTIGLDSFPPRVFFNEFNADSLNILVVYWYAPPAWWDYLAHAERLNLRIFEEYEKAGIEFAFPTQTLFLAGDPKRRLAVEMPPDAPV